MVRTKVLASDHLPGSPPSSESFSVWSQASSFSDPVSSSAKWGLEGGPWPAYQED